MRGGPWTAPLGAPADLHTPPHSPRSGLWSREGHVGRGLLRAPARRCGFVGAGPAAAALTVSPFLLWVGGGGGPPRPLSGLCGRGGGGGGVGGVLRFPGDAPCRPKRGGGRAAWRSQPRGPAIGQGGRALPPPPSTECRILTQSLPGAPHLPAVAARRWPAGGGREGQRSVVSGLRGRFPWVGN